MPSNFLFNGSSYIILSKWLFNTWIVYLNLRQMKLVAGMNEVPEYVRDVYPVKRLERARSYQFEKILLTIVFRCYDALVFTAQVTMGAVPKLWWAAESIATGLFTQSSTFLFLMMAAEALVYLPLRMFNVFVIEQHYGFNRQDVGSFVGDSFREVIIKTIVSMPMLWFTVCLMRWRPDTFHWYLMVITLFFRFALIFVYLEVLFPLLANLKPLPEGQLKSSIQKLASQVGFPLYDIFILEASSRTTHGNAFFIGISTKKMIVFFDTMLEGHLNGNTVTTWLKKKRYSIQELLGILGHEMGHWKGSHIPKGITMLQLTTCLELWSSSYIVSHPGAYRAVGFEGPLPNPIVGLIVIAEMFLLPLELCSRYVVTGVSRHFEIEADAFSVSLGQGEGLSNGLKKITAESLRLHTSDSLYSAWYDTHPPLDVRLAKIETAPAPDVE